MCSDLPRDALGVGLRPPHYAFVHAQRPPIDYFEIISENFLGPALSPSHHLDNISPHYPVVLHGVGLNLLGNASLDETYLDAIARLADRVDAAFVSDHLCWTGAGGLAHHDLLPFPYTEDLVDFAASRAAHVQRRVGRPFGLENVSTYLELAASQLAEPEFYARVVREADCHFMFDINNVFVSCHNHGHDPTAYLDAIDYSRVLQVHLAGHTRLSNGTIIDTHDQPICEEVWALYRRAWQRGGPFPTLIEWDGNVPPMPELIAQLERAREVRS